MLTRYLVVWARAQTFVLLPFVKRFGSPERRRTRGWHPLCRLRKSRATVQRARSASHMQLSVRGVGTSRSPALIARLDEKARNKEGLALGEMFDGYLLGRRLTYTLWAVANFRLVWRLVCKIHKVSRVGGRGLHVASLCVLFWYSFCYKLFHVIISGLPSQMELQVSVNRWTPELVFGG